MLLSPAHHLVLGLVARAEEDDGKARPQQQLQPRRRRDALCEVFCNRAGVGYRQRIGFGAMRRQRIPKRQSSRPARQVQRIVRRVPFAFVHSVEIDRPLTMCRRPIGRVPIQQRAAVIRRKHPFVWVDDQRIRLFDPLKGRTQGRISHCSPTICAIDMHPDAARLGKLRQSRNVIHRAAIGRPAIRDNRKGFRGQICSRCVRTHAPGCVGGNGDEVRIHNPRDSRD